MSQIPFDKRFTPRLRAAFERSGITPHAETILMHSLICSAGRMEAIISAFDDVPHDGDTAEIGCAGGGTSLLIGLINGGRTHWACDTFEGLKDTGAHDDLKDGDFGSERCTHEIVAERLLPAPNVRTVPGYFPDSAPVEMRSSLYCFVHIDVDTYQSIHACFEFFSERMVPGGIMALDDVIGRGTRGAKQAWREIGMRRSRPWRPVSQNDPQVIIQFS